MFQSHSIFLFLQHVLDDQRNGQYLVAHIRLDAVPRPYVVRSVPFKHPRLIHR